MTMTESGNNYPQWNAPSGGQPPQYNQPYYPPPQQQPQYPASAQQQPYYQQQQYPAQPSQQPYPPQQSYGQQQQPAVSAQQSSGQPITIPVEGVGVAKLAARMKPRSLIISPEGFAHQASEGTLRLAWSEMSRIVVTTAYHKKPLGPKTWRIRVVIDAADPSVVQRHPEIAGLQGKFGSSGPGSYGLPLGPVRNIVDQLAQALAMYGGPVFGGVIDEGRVIGLGYL